MIDYKTTILEDAFIKMPEKRLKSVMHILNSITEGQFSKSITINEIGEKYCVISTEKFISKEEMHIHAILGMVKGTGSPISFEIGVGDIRVFISPPRELEVKEKP